MRWTCLWLKCWSGRVPCAMYLLTDLWGATGPQLCNGQVTSCPASPWPSLVCPGSPRKGSPGDGWRGLPALGAACARACLAWWCAEEHNQGCLGLHRFYFQAGNTVRANYEEIFQQTHFSLKSWLRLSLQVAVEERVWQGSVAHRAALAAQWCRSGARSGVWVGTKEQCLPDWYLAACTQWVSSSVVLLLKIWPWLKGEISAPEVPDKREIKAVVVILVWEHTRNILADNHQHCI